MIEELENKYVDLLINRCLSFKKSNSLFINYYSDNDAFVEKLVNAAKSRGIEDIYLDRNDKEERHQKLLQSVEKINNDNYFDDSIWDEYAKKDAAFLMLSTEFPGYFSDVPAESMTAASLKSRTSKPIYKLKQLTNDISWCIAVIPNKIWAKDLFGSEDKDKLWNVLFDICLIREDDPTLAWNKKLAKLKRRADYLNELKIDHLVYQNSLGTNVRIGLPRGYLFCSANAGTGRGKHDHGGGDP